MTSTDLFRQEVLPLFEMTRATYLGAARAVARQIAHQKGEVDINQVRALCPPPPDIDPRVMGAVLRGGEFEPVGYRRSGRRECHNRPIAIFRLKAIQ